MTQFNPYLKWLGIREVTRPINHYRLLGLELFEDDPEVITVAADRQMAHIRTFQNSPRGVISQRIMNELAAARRCLLVIEKKSEYDSQLRFELRQPALPYTQPMPGELDPPIREFSQRSQPAQPHPVDLPELPDDPPVVHPLIVDSSSPAAADKTDPAIGGLNIGIRTDGNQRLKSRKREREQLLFNVFGWLMGGLAAVGVGAWLIYSGWLPTRPATTSAPSVATSGPNTSDASPTKMFHPSGSVGNSALTKKRLPDRSTPTHSRPPAETQPQDKKNRSASEVPQLASEPSPENAKTPIAIRSPGKPLPNTPPVEIVEPPPKLPIPSRSAQIQAANKLKKLYRDLAADARTVQKRRALARKLIGDGRAASDPADRYGLFDWVVQIGIAGGDALIAVEGLREIDSHFKFDYWTEVQSMFENAARNANQVTARDFKKTLDEVIQAAIDQQQFTAARKLVVDGERNATRIGDKSASDQYARLKVQVVNLDQLKRQSKSAAAVLVQTPNDPHANLDQGNSLFVFDDDAALAFEHWKKSGVPELLEIVQLEETLDRKKSDDLVQLANAWQSLGGANRTAVDRKCLQRAMATFSSATSQLNGIEKQQVLNEISQVKSLLEK